MHSGFTVKRDIASATVGGRDLRLDLHVPENCSRAIPANLHDCKAAVRWLRAHAAELVLDGAHIVHGGDHLDWRRSPSHVLYLHGRYPSPIDHFLVLSKELAKWAWTSSGGETISASNPVPSCSPMRMTFRREKAIRQEAHRLGERGYTACHVPRLLGRRR
jgi:hypothetical protein